MELEHSFSSEDSPPDSKEIKATPLEMKETNLPVADYKENVLDSKKSTSKNVNKRRCSPISLICEKTSLKKRKAKVAAASALLTPKKSKKNKSGGEKSKKKKLSRKKKEEKVIKVEKESAIKVKKEEKELIVKKEEKELAVKKEEKELIVKKEEKELIVKKEEKELIAKKEGKDLVVKNEEKDLVVAKNCDGLLKNYEDLEHLTSSSLELLRPNGPFSGFFEDPLVNMINSSNKLKEDFSLEVLKQSSNFEENDKNFIHNAIDNIKSTIQCNGCLEESDLKETLTSKSEVKTKTPKKPVPIKRKVGFKSDLLYFDLKKMCE